MQKYTVKNTITNEISEQDILQAFIDQLLEVGQEYNGFIKASQEEIDNFNEQKINKNLTEAKSVKKRLVDEKRDEFINKTIVKIKIGDNDILNVKIDSQTRNELTQINQGFIAGVLSTNFGDAIDKTTKQINSNTILQYFITVNEVLNDLVIGAYPKARAIKAQIEACTSLQDLDDIVIDF